MFAARGRPLRATVVGCALLLLSAACGGSGDDSARQPRSTPTSDSPTSVARTDTNTTIAGTGASTPACTGAPAPARYDHVVVVVMENKSWSGVLEGQGQWLTARKNECFTATNFVQSASPSRPNYIALVAGATYGCEGSNADPPGGCTPPSPSLFKQVIDAGGIAKNYLGGAQSACGLTSSGQYAVKHAPWPYFADERALCAANAPAVGSAGFLDPEHLPTLAFVSPDLCDDTHDCGVDIGDKYLDTLLSPILASSSYRAGKTAVIVVYDEYTPLPNVLMSESVHPGSTTADASDNLLFHTFESMLGVPLLVGTGDLRAASGL